MRKLNDTHLNMLRFMTAYQEGQGCTPTIREVMEATGMSSSSVANYHIQQLVAAGYVRHCERGSRPYAVTQKGRDEAQGVQRLCFTFPYPPSTNRYWRKFRNQVVMSEEARAYKAQIRAILASYGLSPMAGPIGLKITLYRPQRSGDLTNFVKVLEDAMNGIVYIDDSQTVECFLLRRDDKKNPRAEVEVWEVTDVSHAV